MKTTVRTEAEAVKESIRRLLKSGWHEGEIIEAVEKVARSGNDTIELTILVEGRTLRDWLTDIGKGSLKLRHCCQACGDDVFQRYEAGEVTQEDFLGQHVQVKIGIQKGTRNFPGDRNIIEDYRPLAGSRIVNLR
jgi:hypothetical protein